MSEPILEVRNISMEFPTRRRGTPRPGWALRAVNDVSFTLHEGETLGVVGESGCGKSTTGYCIARAYQPVEGSVIYRREDGSTVDLAELTDKQLKPFRKEVRMIFQDPYSSLNPRMTVFDIIAEPLRIQGMKNPVELERRVAELLVQCGMRPEFMRRYPHAFSGGQRQRLVIARALALDPRIVIADEAVSALDVSVQAQILNLLKKLQAERKLTYIFISHALNVVEYMADRVAVMYLGRVVEIGATDKIYARPRHPYTEALLSAIPVADPTVAGTQIILEGDVPDPARPPSGCPFHPRCRYARDICRTELPPLRSVDAVQVACHLAEELQLAGVGSGTSTMPASPAETMTDRSLP
ncbi:MAG: peptide ABC transporter ATP-binding protein [Pelagibacterium sp. SCN 64-44]|nr:MAG: peptide ABC transporter ATP-binding protein [Pelagibacterium sp. SCN 64-44]